MTQQATVYDDDDIEEVVIRPRPRPASKVRSVPMVDGGPVERTRSKSRVIALFAIAIALPAWLEGARTTRDGWILALNWIIYRLSGYIVVVPPSLYTTIAASLLMLLLGYGYSRVEIQHAPIRPPRDWRRNFFKWSLWHIEPAWQKWVIWFTLIATDVGTMYLGARQPQPTDPAIFHQIAASVQAAAVYAIILTFIPDQLLRYGWRNLRG